MSLTAITQTTTTTALGLGSDPLAMIGPTGDAALNRLGASVFSNDWIGQWMVSEMAFQQRLTMMMLGLMQGNAHGLGGGKGKHGSAQGPGGSGGSGGASASQAGGAQTQNAGPISPEDKKWLTGDTDGLEPRLAGALAQVGKKIGKKLEIKSGFRSRQEQEKLYAAYKAGTGNLAARPGTSNHESGRAADVYVDGVPLNSHPEAKAAAASVGIHFPVPGEAWHAELKSMPA